MKERQFGRGKEGPHKRQKKDMKYRKFVGNKVEGTVKPLIVNTPD